MRLRLIAAGTRMPAWVVEATADYARRLPREWRLELTEVPLGQRGRDLARARRLEGARMVAALGPRDRVVALCVEGEAWSTQDLARRLHAWRQEGRDLAFLIGGPDGLHEDCRARAELAWSLSPLTLPHALVRIVVAEQLYRAWSILSGHPYHRA